MKVPFEELSVQCQRVLQWLGIYERIDPIHAMTELGIMRLAARINDLEKAGYLFEHEPVESENRFGEKVRFMSYKFKKVA